MVKVDNDINYMLYRPLTEYELALWREECCVLLMYLYLLESLYQLTVLGQHELCLQPWVDQTKHVCS